MKINQTETQLELTTNGLLQAIIGTILVIAGIIVVVAVLSGVIVIDGNKVTPLWGSIIGLILVIAGGFSAFFARNQNINLQKGGSSSVSAKRVFGGQPQNTTFDTSKVVAVSLSTRLVMDNNSSSSNNSSQKNRQHSDLSLILDDNSMISIASSGNGSSFSFGFGSLISKAPLSKEAEQIATYLGVPIKSSGMVNTI